MHVWQDSAEKQVLHGLIHGLQLFEYKYFPETQDVHLISKLSQVRQFESHG